MEASVATPPAEPAEIEPAFDGEAEATRTVAELFQWSGYVHVGAGAEECPQRAVGGCVDPQHFHAWVCLPNTFQIRDIVDKARAAKARKVRALRDAGSSMREASDSYVVLEDELDRMRDGDGYEHLLTVTGGEAVDRRLPAIIAEVNEDPKWEHHAQDIEEFQRLQRLPDDERPAEEYEQLQREMVEWAAEFEARAEEERVREMTRLRTMPVDDVIELMRKVRIEEIANEAYLHHYYTWAMFIGAREPSADGFPQQRKFPDVLTLKMAAPEIVTALREKIRTLEERTSSERSEASGN